MKQTESKILNIEVLDSAPSFSIYQTYDLEELLNFSDPSYNTLKHGVDACTDEKTELEGQHFLAVSPWASCTVLHFTGPQGHQK